MTLPRNPASHTRCMVCLWLCYLIINQTVPLSSPALLSNLNTELYHIYLPHTRTENAPPTLAANAALSCEVSISRYGAVSPGRRAHTILTFTGKSFRMVTTSMWFMPSKRCPFTCATATSTSATVTAPFSWCTEWPAWIYSIYVTDVKSCDCTTMQSTSRKLVTQRTVERYTVVVEVGEGWITLYFVLLYQPLMRGHEVA